MIRTTAGISLIAIGLTGAAASPPQEWERFRREVESTCLQAIRLASAVNASDRVEIRASVYGSQSYGTALVTASNDRRHVRRYVCIMDKGSRQTEFAEIDGPLRSPGR